MSLNRGEVNALNVLGLRKLSFIPKHFSKISLENNIDIKLLGQWIEFNLNSRYAIQTNLGLDDNRKMVSIIEVGFEDPKELTIFTIGCQHLHTKRK